MRHRIANRRLVLAVGAAAVMLAARRAAYAPADPEVAARAEAAERSGPWTHGYATVNGVRLHYAEMGSGPLVVLLHGFPECWYMWRNVMPRLAQRFHVVAPDLRGYNRSDKPPGVGSYTVDAVARDIAALVEAFGRERAHIVGHDWGGSVAWHMGMRYAQRVDKLAVVNAPHPAAFERELKRLEQLARSWYVVFFQLPFLPEAVVRLTLRRGLRESAAVPGSFTDEALDVYENGVSQPGAVTTMLNYYRAAFRAGPAWFSDNKRPIERPTMLLWGMKDVALTPRLTEGLEPWVRDLRVERVADSGHWVPEEKPRVVGDLLVDFLGA
jgi:epoxide hydrolase 4